MAVSRMKIEKITTVEQDCDFCGLTLLSIDEYEKHKCKIKPLSGGWWLRSHGNIQYSAALVRASGALYYCNVDYDVLSVRPALILNLKSPDLKIDDEFKCYNHNWTVISDRYALCDDELCYMAFRKNCNADDSNDYDASDIKKYLDDEWRRMKNGEQDDEG